MGAGVITIPQASRMAGWGINIVFIMIGCWLGIYSCRLLVKLSIKIAAKRHRDLTVTDAFRSFMVENEREQIDYDMLADLIISKKAKKMVQVAYLMLILGQSVSQTNLIGDNISLLLTDHFGEGVWSNSRIWMAVITMIVIFPLSMIRELNELRYLSLFQLGVILQLIAAMVVYGLKLNSWDHQLTISSKFEHSIKNISSDDFWGIVLAFPLVCFSFAVQPWVLPIYQELNNKNMRRMSKVIDRSFFLAAFLQMLAGYLGFMMFQNNTKDNILSNDFRGSVAMLIGRILLTVSITTCMPQNVFPMRNAILSML